MQGWLDKQIKVMGVSRINLGSVCSGSVVRSLPSRPPAVILESNLGCSTYIERSNFPHDIPWHLVAKPQMVPMDFNIDLQGLVLIQGQIYNPAKFIALDLKIWQKVT